MIRALTDALGETRAAIKREQARLEKEVRIFEQRPDIQAIHENLRWLSVYEQDLIEQIIQAGGDFQEELPF